MINLPHNAFMDVYLPCGVSNKKSILLVPGGGYHIHADFIEGEPIAKAYAQKGFTAFVLHYSVKTTAKEESDFPYPLRQACFAIKHIRDNKDKYNVGSFVAVSGFSAGGHLAGMLGLLCDSKFVSDIAPLQTLRPDCLVLGYPVVSTDPSCCHDWSINNLLSCYKDNEYEQLKQLVSLEDRVCSTSPPLFIWVTLKDDAVNINNSVRLVQSYINSGVAVEFHLYPVGRHGLGLATKDATPDETYINDTVSTWFEMSVDFITNQ